MNHSTAVKRLSKKLRQDLAGWRLPDVPPKAIKVVCPPALTTDTYEGVSLSRVIVPVCRVKPDDLDSMFCDLVEWTVAGKDEAKKQDLLPHVPQAARKFVKYSIPRFILWASQCEDMRLSVSDNRLLCEGEITIGMAGGMLTGSRLCIDFPFYLDGLDESTVFSCRESVFHALWYRAQSLGNLKAQTALAALRAYSVHPLSKILTWTTQVAAPTTVTDKIGDILVKSADPVADVYLLLVPHYTPRAYFERNIAKLDTRPLNPGQDYRYDLWEKLREAALI